MANEISFQAGLRSTKQGFSVLGQASGSFSMAGLNMIGEPQFVALAGAAINIGLIASPPRKMLVKNLDPLLRWKVSAVAVNDAGSGYANGNVVTVPGNDTNDVGATVTLIVTAGVVTGLSLTTAGSYTTDPPTPAIVTGGAGSGLLIDLTTINFTGNFVTLHGNSGFSQAQDKVTPQDAVLRSPTGTIYAKPDTTGLWIAVYAVEA